MKADLPSQSTAETWSALGAPAWISTILALIAGAILRIWMLHKFFEVNGDSQLYGGMAKNLLLSGNYALTDGAGAIHATLIRLPGYPLFLAACFRLFGMENYFAPACIQIGIELAGCVLLALFVYRISSRLAAANATLWLAALCPFTAIYAAEPLTEALSVFCVVIALWAAARFEDAPRWKSALVFTAAITYAAFLRPDGALLGISFAPVVAWRLLKRDSTNLTQVTGTLSARARWSMLATCLFLALAPFAVWTARNWNVFHVVQPLAPRYATDPGEETYPGFQRWTKTWCLDFVSTYQLYWNMPNAPLDINLLPDRAFDSPAQRAETADLLAAYEKNGEEVSPALDDRFAQLAQERISSRPLRYYVWLPLGRVVDMWLRPRVENLPIDLDWWVYKHHHVETRFSWAYAGLNALYVALGFAGLCLRPRFWLPALAYMVLRSALLATIEAPEARYTIECFPFLFAFGGIAIARMVSIRRPRSKIL